MRKCGFEYQDTNESEKFVKQSEGMRNKKYLKQIKIQ